MAQVVRVRRLASNPHRRKRRASSRRRNARGHRRRLTTKQIRFFGTPAQKAALKRNRRRKTHSHSRPARRRRRSTNPALVVSLGAFNPRRKRVARKRTKSRSHSHRGRRRTRNTTRIVVRAPRRHNRRRRHRNVMHFRRRRRNPSLFGANVSTSVMAQAVLGGLVGVTAAKLIPAALPASLASTPTMRVIAAGASAFAAGWAAGKVNKTFGDAVLFGGLMQAGSMLLNVFVPSVGRQIGLGDLVDGRFVVPQNPLRLPAPVAAPAGPNARVTMSGLTRAFGTAL